MGVLLNINNNLNRKYRALCNGNESNCVEDIVALCERYSAVKEDALLYPLSTEFGSEAEALIQSVGVAENTLQQDKTPQMTK